MLSDLRERLGLALMLITHDLSVLFQACERVAVMYAGRVVEQGPSGALMSTPQHPYTAALAAAFPTIGDRASRKAPQGLGGDPPDPQQLPTGCSFHPRCAVALPECTRSGDAAVAGRRRPRSRLRQGARARRARRIGDGELVSDDGPVIELRDLKVSYRGRGLRSSAPVARAVDGVNLRLDRGEVVALVGESGCGKSTLARAVMGLLAANGRRDPVRRRARRLFDARRLKAYRKQVQLVLQDPTGALNPRQSVYESVAEGLRIHHVAGDEEKLVAAALSRCGLRPPERFFLRYPHELSGGQRQRVVVAGALVLDPSVLVADEPVSSLDASVRGEILALLLNLVRELGLSILVITHDLGLAWNIADRVAVMYLGRIVEEGPTEEILSNPKHPYTQALLSVVSEVEHLAPQVLAGEPPDPTRIPGGCRFHPRCPALASGAAAAAGVAHRCRSELLAPLPDRTPHGAACFLSDVEQGMLTD